MCEEEEEGSSLIMIPRSSVWLFYLIQFALLAGEGEGEPHGELLVFDVVFFHEVSETLRHMVEQLEQQREGRSCLTIGSTGARAPGFPQQPTFVPVP